MPLLVLDFGLDIVDGVRRLHLKGDGLPHQDFHEDLHFLRRQLPIVASTAAQVLENE